MQPELTFDRFMMKIRLHTRYRVKQQVKKCAKVEDPDRKTL